MSITLTVNGVKQSCPAPPEMPLLWALRDVLGLTGAKYGCGVGLCGACTVHVDGAAARACLLPLSRVAGKNITTIEGLSPAGEHPVQQAWRLEDVAQCGYCQPGQIMTAAALLAKHPKPSDEDIAAAMTGNLCRCGTYQRICAAVRRAAALQQSPGK